MHLCKNQVEKDLESKTIGHGKPDGMSEKEKSLQMPAPPNPPEYITQRTMKLVFAPWAPGRQGSEQDKATRTHDKKDYEIPIEIWKGGIRSVIPDE